MTRRAGLRPEREAASGLGRRRGLPWHSGGGASHWNVPAALRLQVALPAPTMRYPGLQKKCALLPSVPAVRLKTPPFLRARGGLQ